METVLMSIGRCWLWADECFLDAAFWSTTSLTFPLDIRTEEWLDFLDEPLEQDADGGEVRFPRMNLLVLFTARFGWAQAPRLPVRLLISLRSLLGPNDWSFSVKPCRSLSDRPWWIEEGSELDPKLLARWMFLSWTTLALSPSEICQKQLNNAPTIDWKMSINHLFALKKRHIELLFMFDVHHQRKQCLRSSNS